MTPSSVSRRTFVKSAALGSAVVAFPHVMRSQQGVSPNSRLNVACIGVGGRGAAAVNAMKGESLVAFCDVDDARAARTFDQHPNVPRFRDYRRLLDQLGRSIDAVTISTPDHMHFPIAMTAMSLGKHVFVEKPMAHTIEEGHRMARLAREKKVATQMGNQGHAAEGMRLLKEWYQAGVLGDIVELHTWTDRPIWPQGVAAPAPDRPATAVPSTLDWDLWLGVAAARPYDPAYLPRSWRGYFDFGTGVLGDMGCHQMDGVYWALGLTQPTRLEASSAQLTDVSYPKASVVTYEFPARGRHPALTWKWYDGGLVPPLPVAFEPGRKLIENGTLVVGSKATVLADATYASVRIVPEIRMRELAPSLPLRTLPRVKGTHFAEWVEACKGGPPAGANFEYSAQLTETVLLSCVAVRAQRRIEWDAAAMRVTNVADANRFVAKEYRPGFGV